MKKQYLLARIILCALTAAGILFSGDKGGGKP